jgi:hypothetical protein
MNDFAMMLYGGKQRKDLPELRPAGIQVIVQGFILRDIETHVLSVRSATPFSDFHAATSTIPDPHSAVVYNTRLALSRLLHISLFHRAIFGPFKSGTLRKVQNAPL